jgi:hypothetical protein
MARAVQAGLCAASLFTAGIFLLFYVSSIAGSVDYPGEPRLRFTAGTIVYIFLPVVAASITIVDLIVTQVVLFPSDSKLRKFNPPGATIG